MTLAFSGKLNPLRGIKNPSIETIAEVGQYYLNIKTNELFLCTKIENNKYIWKSIVDLSLWDLLSNYQMDYSSQQELHQYVAAIGDFLHGLETRKFDNTTYIKFDDTYLNIFNNVTLLPDGIAYNFDREFNNIYLKKYGDINLSQTGVATNFYLTNYIKSTVNYTDYSQYFNITTPIFKVADRFGNNSYIMQWGSLSTGLYLGVYQNVNNQIVADIKNQFNENSTEEIFTNTIDLIDGHSYYVNFSRTATIYSIDIYDVTTGESHIVEKSYDYHGNINASTDMLFGTDYSTLNAGNHYYWYNSLDFSTFKVNINNIEIINCYNKINYISSYLVYSNSTYSKLNYTLPFNLTTPTFKVFDKPDSISCYIMQYGSNDAGICLDLYQNSNKLIANISGVFDADPDNNDPITGRDNFTNAIDIIADHKYYVNFRKDDLFFYIDIYDVTAGEVYSEKREYQYASLTYSASDTIFFGADYSTINNLDDKFWYESLDFNTFKVIIGDEEVITCLKIYENTAEIAASVADQKYKALSQYGKDVVNKYINIPGLSDMSLKALIIESGYEYITDVIDLTSIQLRNIVYYLPLIHSLKGTKTGLEILLACITGTAIITEWWENIFEIEDNPGNYQLEIPYTYKVTLLDLYEQELPPKLFSTLIRYSSEYVYPLLRELTIRVTNEIDPIYFYIICEVTNEYTAQVTIDYIIDGQSVEQAYDKILDGQSVKQPIQTIIDAGTAQGLNNNGENN